MQSKVSVPVVPKLPNWDVLLAKELRMQRSFQWGVNDCCLFAGDAIKAMTGFDPAQGFRGKYTSARGAIRELRRQGFDDVDDLLNRMTAALGFKPIDIAFASTGDIVSADLDGFTGVGVVHQGYGIFLETGGYLHLEKNLLDKAWSTG